MTRSDEHEIIDRWKDEPAPLLPVLQALHDRDGYLSEDALRAVAAGLRIPIADLFGPVTFYHHFAREPGGLDAPRVCTGPICKMKGAEDLVAALNGATPMPCSGRCDDPIPVLRGHHTLVGLSAESLESKPSPLPPAAQESRGQASIPPEPASLSGHPWLRGPPHGRQQCGDAGVRAAHRATRCGLVSGAGGRRTGRHQGDKPLG